MAKKNNNKEKFNEHLKHQLITLWELEDVLYDSGQPDYFDANRRTSAL